MRPWLLFKSIAGSLTAVPFSLCAHSFSCGVRWVSPQYAQPCMGCSLGTTVELFRLPIYTESKSPDTRRPLVKRCQMTVEKNRPRGSIDEWPRTDLFKRQCRLTSGKDQISIVPAWTGFLHFTDSRRVRRCIWPRMPFGDSQTPFEPISDKDLVLINTGP
ncbi:uncharacterized protein J3D65DRAFT_628876 [Phyllosticta citribraziliensis]|uniref:Secreted protein n=1 Tax=Phyllosticta citribraziliensis TaxID=989973 RepID=A0ABR1LHP7_9PEZI